MRGLCQELFSGLGTKAYLMQAAHKLGCVQLTCSLFWGEV